MYGGEREQEILQLLDENGFVTVAYLAARLHISPSSVRRDLASLEAKGRLRRSYGGAEAIRSGTRVIPFALRTHQMERAKEAVARCAAALCKPGDTVFLDGSTSASFLAAPLSRIGGLTVVTDSLTTMLALAEAGKLRAICTGGQPNPENPTCLVGESALTIPAGMHADLAFFSVQSLSADGELSDCFRDELPYRELILARARRAVFLCDGSKHGRTSPYVLCHLNQVDTVVSDTPEPEEIRRLYPDLHWLIA